MYEKMKNPDLDFINLKVLKKLDVICFNLKYG